MASSNDDVQCPRPWERRTYAHETITSHGRSAPAAGGKTAGEHAGVGGAPAGRADGWDQLKGPRAVAFLFREPRAAPGGGGSESRRRGPAVMALTDARAMPMRYGAPAGPIRQLEGLDRSLRLCATSQYPTDRRAVRPLRPNGTASSSRWTWSARALSLSPGYVVWHAIAQVTCTGAHGYGATYMNGAWPSTPRSLLENRYRYHGTESEKDRHRLVSGFKITGY